MSGTWSNDLAVTKLLLPSNGVESPGSGTTVIGGKLPDPFPTLFPTNAYSGIVWYTNAAEWAGGTGNRYWFMSFNDENGNGDVSIGYVNNAGVIKLVAEWNKSTTEFTSNSGFAFRNSDYTSGAALTASYALNSLRWAPPQDHPLQVSYIQNGFGSTGLGALFATDSSADDAYIKNYMTGSYTDKWFGPIAGPSGTFNGGAYTSSYRYFVSFDRMVTVSWTVTFSTQPTAGNMPIANFLPAGIVPIASGPNIYGSGMDNQAGAAIQRMLCRVDAGSRSLSLFTVNASATVYNGTVTYPTAKPGF